MVPHSGIEIKRWVGTRLRGIKVLFRSTKFPLHSIFQHIKVRLKSVLSIVYPKIVHAFWFYEQFCFICGKMVLFCYIFQELFWRTGVDYFVLIRLNVVGRNIF